MTITNGYCTLVDLKARLGIPASDTSDDSALESVITAVSRWIDKQTRRRFYTTTSDETRYYTAVDPDLLVPGDDIVSITTLATDDNGDRVYETTWGSADYDLEPYNAAVDGEPYQRISIAPNGNCSFPTTRKGVKIVGKFGYASIPAAITEACILASEKYWKRSREAPLGLAGSPEIGQVVVPAKDRAIFDLLQPFEKISMEAI
jgi:hypothetical protein